MYRLILLVVVLIYLFGVRKQLGLWLESIHAVKSVLGFLVWIDRGGNVLAGGHWHSTISARVGFFSYEMNQRGSSRRHHWRFFESIIDWAFRPIDGKRHCFKAMKLDGDKDFHHGGTVRLFVLSILVCLFAPLIGILIRACQLFRPSFNEL